MNSHVKLKYRHSEFHHFYSRNISTSRYHSHKMLTLTYSHVIQHSFPKNVGFSINCTKFMQVLLPPYHIAAPNIAARKQHKVNACQLCLYSRQQLRFVLLKSLSNNPCIVFFIFFIAANLPLLRLYMSTYLNIWKSDTLFLKLL